MDNLAEGTTRDGRAYIVRRPSLDDVDSALTYINRLSSEQTFVSFQGEQLTHEDEQKFIERAIEHYENRTGVHLFLMVDGAVMGICGVDAKPRSESHVGDLGISLDASVRGEGLGRMLMEETLALAEQHITDLRLITLTVKGPNAIARSLYEKLGFTTFGCLPHGTMHQGEFVDEIYMYRPVAREDQSNFDTSG